MLRRSLAVLAAMALLHGTASAALSEPAPAASSAPATDYADPAAWLCRPGRADDACGRSRLDATLIEADGSLRVEHFRADPKAPIDCFYVYPTVSLDPGGNADLKPDRQEYVVVEQQFARFASVCRPFAPLYRQVTLTALRSNLAGNPVAVDRDLPYRDVKAAWDHYLAHDNRGRGVVLIGHSQGSLVLAELVRREIDGKPVRNRLLSVILAGYRLQVPVGKDVGGDFRTIPLCRAAGQTGCAINFASFRADRPPPPEGKIFAASAGPGLEAACVNPAAIAGGSGPLHAYLPASREGLIVDGAPPGPWTSPARPVTTLFVEVPGLLGAECINNGSHNYLAVTLHPTPGGARTETITGDVMRQGRVLPDWGLHIVDVNLTIGNLIELVRAQGAAYIGREGARR